MYKDLTINVMFRLRLFFQKEEANLIIRVF